MRHLLVLVIVALLGVAACSGDGDTSVATDAGGTADGSDEPEPGDAGQDIDGSWTLVMLVEEEDMAIPLPEGAVIDLRIDGSEIGGTAACNSYGGSVEVGEDGSFATSDLFQTEMACDPPELMDMEIRYLTALGGSTSWAIEDGQLVVSGPDAMLTFERTPDPVDADLKTTVWQLDSFYDGTGPEGSVTNQIGMEQIRLTLADEEARLESPCGTATGSAVVGAGGEGSIELALIPEDDGCSDQEQALVADAIGRLDRVDRFEIDASQLTLSSGDAPVIGFTAG